MSIRQWPGVIVADILRLLECFSSTSTCFVKRSANRVAHTATQKAVRGHEFSTCMGV